MTRGAVIGRAIAALAAVGLLVAIVRAVGVGATLPSLARVAPWLPLLGALEAGVVAFDAIALAALYRAAGRTAPARPFWRAVFLANVVAAGLPLGRLLSEGWKAVRLAPRVGGPVAAAGAVGSQAAVLLGNAAIALVSLAGVALRCGATWPTLAVGGLALVMSAAGLAVALAGRARLGRWLGARFTIARAQGPAFDDAFAAATPALGVAAAWETAARLLQIAQVATLLHALGHPAGAVDALAAHGLVLTGAALGDALPGQLGATDALLALAAVRLDLAAPDALALTLGLHGAQLGLALVGGAAALALSDDPAPHEGPA
ncbi:MAG: hypothetical protein EPO40_02695 [Myxococcaceae bacterium]|nr:MAG: hypothetical protein EPO40_02695 [Myxococcaceae bacterium]